MLLSLNRLLYWMGKIVSVKIELSFAPIKSNYFVLFAVVHTS